MNKDEDVKNIDTVSTLNEEDSEEMSYNELIKSRHEQCHMKDLCSRHETCPMVLVYKMISGKWKLLILWYLTPGPLRFSDIKRKLPNVTQKMLTNQLRSLEEDELIYRKVYPVIPPKVEYGLTSIGMEMYSILEKMYSFGIRYMEQNDGETLNNINMDEV